MTQITDIVTVNVSIADTVLSRAGFGTALILADVESAVFTERTKIYNNITEIGSDFSNDLDVYKAAAAFFAISPRPAFLKVGRQEVGDADAAAALAEIELEDDDWYCLLMTNHLAVDQIDGNDYVKARQKIFLAESEDAAMVAAGSTAAVTSLTRTLQVVAAITTAPHSLSDGDLVEIVDAVEPEYNGTFVISNASGSDFDYTIVGSPSSPATGTILWAPGAVDALWNTANEQRSEMFWHHAADTQFPASAWAARQLPKDPGASTWNFKQLTGISGSEITDLTTAEEAFLLAKNTNVYTFIGSTGVAATRLGTMAGGRFIDVQRSQDWLQARVGEAILLRLLTEPKVPYTDKGGGILRAEISEVMQTAVNFGMLGPLLDSDSGEFWRIFVPKVADQSANDRAARNFPGIVVTAQLAGAIHSTVINVNVSV